MLGKNKNVWFFDVFCGSKKHFWLCFWISLMMMSAFWVVYESICLKANIGNGFDFFWGSCFGGTNYHLRPFKKTVIVRAVPQ